MKDKILAELNNYYPNSKIALNFSNHWELLVAVVLSAQCTDKKVNEVTLRLFNKYKSIADYAAAIPEEFEKDIRATGFFRNKTKNIIFTAKIIQNKFSGKVPNTMEDLLSLPGIARKTANIILGNAFEIVVGIAVDTHVARISQRLRLVNPDTIGGKTKLYFQRKEMKVLDYIKDAYPDKIEQLLMQVIPKDNWFMFTYQLIDHGRAICRAQNPKCIQCPLKKICPAFREI